MRYLIWILLFSLLINIAGLALLLAGELPIKCETVVIHHYDTVGN